MGLDTVSGLLRIVVNGKVVVDEEKQYFKDTSAWKPKSVAGHLLGKALYNLIKIILFHHFSSQCSKDLSGSGTSSETPSPT